MSRIEEDLQRALNYLYHERKDDFFVTGLLRECCDSDLLLDIDKESEENFCRDRGHWECGESS